MRRSNQPRWVGLGWDFLVVAACKEGVGKAFAGDQAVSSRNRPPLGTWGRRGAAAVPAGTSPRGGSAGRGAGAARPRRDEASRDANGTEPASPGVPCCPPGQGHSLRESPSSIVPFGRAARGRGGGKGRTNPPPPKTVSFVIAGGTFLGEQAV